MPTTRERALDAALQLLGTEGVRSLTHARIDSSAGLPPGSTSNWFRTRRALLRGVVDHLAEQERGDVDPSGVPSVHGTEELIEVLCLLFEAQTGPFAARTRARYSLWLDLGSDSELGAPLRHQRHEFERWTEQLIRGAGLPDPAGAPKAIMALSDGLILHRLTVDPSLDARPILSRSVRSLSTSR
jgi:DNA-binding transcriptional regulator YbjK